MLILFNSRQINERFERLEMLLKIAIETQDQMILLTNRNQEEFMMRFSEYRDAVDNTLSEVLTLVASESVEIQNAIALAADQGASSADIEAAFNSLNEKRKIVAESIQGLISSVPVPTPPIVLPSDPSEPLPVPEVPTSEPVPPAQDPEVPIDATPSSDGVGIDSGFDLSTSSGS